MTAQAFTLSTSIRDAMRQMHRLRQKIATVPVEIVIDAVAELGPLEFAAAELFDEALARVSAERPEYEFAHLAHE